LILCSYSNVDKPSKTLALLTPSTGKLEEIPIPYQTFGSVDVREDGRLGLIGHTELRGQPKWPCRTAIVIGRW